MKKLIAVLILIWCFAVTVNLYSINITESKNWSAITPTPTSTTDINIVNNATLTVDVANAVCRNIQVGRQPQPAPGGTGTLLFNSNSVLTVHGTMTVGQGNTLGTLTMGSGTILQLKTTISFSNGSTFTCGSGSVEFNGNDLQTIPPLTYYNVIINNVYNGVILGGNISVNNEFLVNQGRKLDCGSYVISGIGKFSLYSSPTLKPSTFRTSHPGGINGSISVSGDKFLSTHVNYEFYGSDDQVTGTLLPVEIYNLKIYNYNRVTLSGNTKVLNECFINWGLFDLGGYVLTIENKLEFDWPDETSMIVLDNGTNSGTLRKKLQNKEILYPFHVGNTTINRANYYTPVTVNFSAGPSTGTYVSLQMKAEELSGNLGDPRLKRYWTFTGLNFLSPEYTLTLRFPFEDIIIGENPPELLTFGRYSDGVWDVLDEGVISIDLTNEEYRIFTISNYSGGFGIFTGGDGQSPYPVKLASFNFAVNNRNVMLNWVTEIEENNSGFEIQKTGVGSQETEIWNKIGFVKGKGNSKEMVSYSFEDRNIQTGKYKYRLKQIDYNGNFEYFELAGVVEVGVPAKFDLSQNYPNPFNPVTKINFDIPQSGLVTLKVYDLLGKEVAIVLNEMKDAGYYTVNFDASGLSSGVYFYRLSSNDFSNVKRLVVLK